MNRLCYVVVGLGLTGIACVRYLVDHHYNVTVVDSRQRPPELGALKKEYPNIKVYLGGITDESLAGADELVVSPGVPLNEPSIARAMDAGVSVCGDIDLFCRELRSRELFSHKKAAPIVAITGSNGKSTVTTLVGEMVRAAGKKVAVGGNIGVPALELLNEDNPDCYVLELSSFQLERNESLNAEVATVLNVSEDHMDRYTDVASYCRAKQRIFHGCHQAVVNRLDPLSTPPKTEGMKLWSFGLEALELDKLDPHAFGVVKQSGMEYLAYESVMLMPIAELKMAGRHNIANSLAALALARAIDLPVKPSLDVLRQFPGLPHRCEWVGDIDGVSFYNDSKGTNVGAVIATITGLNSGKQNPMGKIVLIAGGQSKDADFSPLLPVLKHYCRAAVLIGEAAQKLEILIEGALPTKQVTTMSEAVNHALLMAKQQDSVLLSPACASFDMFENYEQRGNTFMQAVFNHTGFKSK